MSFEQIPLPVPQWRDLLEILIVAFVIYRLLLVLVGTRALQIVFGLLILAAIYFAALLLKLSMITYLLGVVFTYGVIAALVVFQPELRHALARLGQTRVFRLFGGEEQPAVAGEIAKATIFSPYSPLHDGAVIVRGNQIVGAGTILPLTQSRVNDRTLGTRHRAALGLSEETDALVLVVSEETAAISLARRGQLLRDLTPEQVRSTLCPPAS